MNNSKNIASFLIRLRDEIDEVCARASKDGHNSDIENFQWSIVGIEYEIWFAEAALLERGAPWEKRAQKTRETHEQAQKIWASYCVLSSIIFALDCFNWTSEISRKKFEEDREKLMAKHEIDTSKIDKE